jgi:methylated-DNA-[protein]-cysteine S-methyltransferase
MAGASRLHAQRVAAPRSAVPNYAVVLASPIGWLGVRADGELVTAVDFLDAPCHGDPNGSPAATQIAVALTAYFDDPNQRFVLPLAPYGTPFQQHIWSLLLAVPVGTTITYGALAQRANTGARAAASACKANPIPVFIPCHRVVAHAGLGGYAGASSGPRLAMKRWLLEHERRCGRLDS